MTSRRVVICLGVRFCVARSAFVASMVWLWRPTHTAFSPPNWDILQYSAYMDKQNRKVLGALDFAQRTEHGRDIGRRVFVYVGHSHKWVEDQQAWFELGDGCLEPPEVFCPVESEDGNIEQVDGQPRQRKVAGLGQAAEALAQGGQAVFGAIEQDRPLALDREVSQRFFAGGHGQGQFGGQVSFTHLGRAAQYPDPTGQPQVFDQPALLDGLGGHIGHVTNRQWRKRLTSQRRRG